MSLNNLASEIESMAEAEAKKVTDEARTQAESIRKAAHDGVKEYSDGGMANAERTSSQIAVESIAAARQRNQKRLLVVQRAELDSTWDEIVATVGSKSMGDRGKILESLLKEAKSTAEKGMVLQPVKTDRAALSKGTGQFKIEEDIDGLGGFVLESNDGSVMMDYRFKGRLREAWDSSLGEVSRILFRDRV